MVASKEALGEGHIGTHLVDVTRTTRVVARCLYAAAERLVALEAHHVVGLPAMQADGGLLQLGNRLVCVHADGGITFLCNLVGFANQFFFHEVLNFYSL